MKSESLWRELLSLDQTGEGLSAKELELVGQINSLGEEEIIDQAIPMLNAKDVRSRKVAATVLAEHGFKEGRPYGGRVVPALILAARQEADEWVRAIVVESIGRANDPRWASDLLEYASDTFAPVRRAVAESVLYMFGEEFPSESAMEALLELSRDHDADVREWATVSLAGYVRFKDVRIRDALRARLVDDGNNGEISGEAALGLASAGDPQAFSYLSGRLAESHLTIGNVIIEATGLLGDRRLLPRLHHLRRVGWKDVDGSSTVLEMAIDLLNQAN